MALRFNPFTGKLDIVDIAPAVVPGDLWSDPVDASIVPDTTNTYRIGSTSLGYNAAYIDDRLYVGGNGGSSQIYFRDSSNVQTGSIFGSVTDTISISSPTIKLDAAQVDLQNGGNISMQFIDAISGLNEIYQVVVDNSDVATNAVGLFIQSGEKTGGSGDGGYYIARGGDLQGGTTSGISGVAQLLSGRVRDTSIGSTGAVTVKSGAIQNASTGVGDVSGDVSVGSGTNAGLGATGTVFLSSAGVTNAGSSAVSGNLDISTGDNAGAGDSGDINLETGASTSGVTGAISLKSDIVVIDTNEGSFNGGIITSPRNTTGGLLDLGAHFISVESGRQKDAGSHGGTGTMVIRSGEVRQGAGSVSVASNTGTLLAESGRIRSDALASTLGDTGPAIFRSGKNDQIGNTGAVTVKSGDAGTGNSGDVTLQVGSASGTTGVFKFNVNGGALVNIGDVWTASQTDGTGYWAAAAAAPTAFDDSVFRVFNSGDNLGIDFDVSAVTTADKTITFGDEAIDLSTGATGSFANASLSNLDTTSVNADLIGAKDWVINTEDGGSNTYSLTIRTGNESGDGTGALTLKSGDDTSATATGLVTLASGDVTGAADSGDVHLKTGDVSGAADSGDIILETGTAGTAQGLFKFLKSGDTTTVGHVWTAAGTAGEGYWAASDIWNNGVTGSRPGGPVTGQTFFDTTIGLPIWYDGANWIDAAGTTV